MCVRHTRARHRCEAPALGEDADRGWVWCSKELLRTWLIGRRSSLSSLACWLSSDLSFFE